MYKKIVLIGIIILLGAVAFLYFYKQPNTTDISNLSPTPTNAPTATSIPTPTSSAPAAINLHAAPVVLSNGKKFNLNIPENYSLSVAAQGFRRARFMAMSPDGRLFFGDMTSASDTHTGKVYVLDGFNKQSGTFQSQHIYLSNLRNPNSVAFYTDPSGAEWIYIALTDKLIRYPYKAGDITPSGAAQTIATFPDTPHNPPQGYWHLTRTVIIQNNQVYVSVGSSCDSCEENESLRGVIVQMDPDGGNLKIIASGLRNAVGIIYAQGNIFATVNEPDKLGTDKPNDVLYKIVDGTNYGWPYCYQYQNKIFADTSQAWTKQFDCTTVPLAWAAFPAHSAPLGLAYFDNSFADPALHNAILVALHGSGDATIGTGNAVTLATQNSSPVDFITGFLQNGKRLARPVDILQLDNNSFFVTDDLNGVIYYLNYKN